MNRHHPSASTPGRNTSRYGPRHVSHLVAAGLTATVASAAILGMGTSATAAGPAILLGTSQEFAVLGGAGVTNTGSTTIDMAGAGVRGDVGTYPTDTITGRASVSWLTPSGGGFHEADAVAQTAQADGLTAYGTAAGAPSTNSLGGQLDTLHLGPGVHTASSALNLASEGTLTLDAGGDPDADFVIQVGTSLTIESGAVVDLVGSAQPCHVFWQVSDDATIGTDVDFVGTLMAENAVVAQTGATITGRLLAQNASVTLDNNTFVLPACAAAQGGGGPGGGGTTTPPTTGTGGTSPTPGSTDSTKDKDKDKDGAKGKDKDASKDSSKAAGSGDSDIVDTSNSTSTDTTTALDTTSLPDTGGPSRTLTLLGSALLVGGVGVAAASRRNPRGAHRAR